MERYGEGFEAVLISPLPAPQCTHAGGWAHTSIDGTGWALIWVLDTAAAVVACCCVPRSGQVVLARFLPWALCGGACGSIIFQSSCQDRPLERPIIHDFGGPLDRGSAP